MTTETPPFIFSSTKPKPPILMVYGTGGAGKTSLAASFPNPIFLPTEASGLVDIPTLTPPGRDRIRSYEEFRQAVEFLRTNEHDRTTVVVDSLSELDKLINAHVCQENGWSRIDQPDYGKGYAAARSVWREAFALLKRLRDQRGLSILLIAHSSVQQFTPPDSESYSRYEPDLHNKVVEDLARQCDGVFFLKQRVSTKREKAGFADRMRAVSDGAIYIFTDERPAFRAKSRFKDTGMPDELSYPKGEGFRQLARFIPFFANAKEQTETKETKEAA